MHPIELMRKHHRSYLWLAEQMGLTEAAVRRWAFNEKASNRRNPPQMAFILAGKIDLELQQQSA